MKLARGWNVFACGAMAAMTLVSQTALAEVVVPLSRSELLEVKEDIGEVIVADPEIADVYAHGRHKVSIIGKALGQTTVRIFDRESNLIRRADVSVSYDLPAIRKALKEFLPYEMIGVDMLNTNIAVTGEVSSTAAAAKAIKIVDEFVEPAYGPKAKNNAQGNTVNKDTAGSPGPQKDTSKVINLMNVTSGQQVMLRVRVGEIRRTALKNLGVNLEAIKNGGDTVFSVATGGGIDAFLSDTGVGFGQYTIDSESARGFASGTFLNSSGNGVSALLEALERDGLFKVLAEPNLVAISGEEAEFLAGGEFPVPVAVDSNSNISIQFKPFGVSVKFLPAVLSESRIRIEVEPEVSEISEEGAVRLEGIDIPALVTRRARTTIELAPGESFMIAGLIQDRMRSTVDQIPGLGEIPILSALFRSTAYQREESELVLAVTPYLVDPLIAGDLKLPTDEFKPASVMENFFYGALGSLSGDAERISQTPSLEGPIGFIVD